MATSYYETLGQEDIRVGASTFTSKNPGGGTLTSTEVGLHSWAVGQLQTTTAWNPASVSAGQSVTTTITVIGAAIGDYALASFSLSLSGLILSASVSAANTVTVVLSNPTTAAVDLASGTLSALVFHVR